MEVSPFVPATVGVFLFDQVELLDFAGPLQVLAAAKHLYSDTIDNIDVIAFQESIEVAKCGLTVRPNVLWSPVERGYDLLIIPGGIGTRAIIKDQLALVKFKALIEKSKIICTVCTGSLLLAKLGMLSHRRATTHFGAVDDMIEIDPSVIIDRTCRYIDHGDVVIAEGVSAGIDMAFYLLSKFYGEDISNEVKTYLEYRH